MRTAFDVVHEIKQTCTHLTYAENFLKNGVFNQESFNEYILDLCQQLHDLAVELCSTFKGFKLSKKGFETLKNMEYVPGDDYIKYMVDVQLLARFKLEPCAVSYNLYSGKFSDLVKPDDYIYPE